MPPIQRPRGCRRARLERSRARPPSPSGRTYSRGLGPLLRGRLAQVGGRGLVRDDHPRPAPLLVLLAPFPEPTAHVLRVDLERVADVLEGEEPDAIRGRDPLARLIVHLAAARVPRVRVLLVAVDRVLEDRQHEEALALEPSLPAEGREELGGQENVRLEEAG